MTSDELATIARDPTLRRPCHGYANTCVCPACKARAQAFTDATEDGHMAVLYPNSDDCFSAAVAYSTSV